MLSAYRLQPVLDTKLSDLFICKTDRCKRNLNRPITQNIDFVKILNFHLELFRYYEYTPKYGRIYVFSDPCAVSVVLLSIYL
jgi:hypothetical protein